MTIEVYIFSPKQVIVQEVDLIKVDSFIKTSLYGDYLTK